MAMADGSEFGMQVWAERRVEVGWGEREHG
jgi:hypothetical protein